jgi:membrane protein DedA with SNARE-associated domain
MELLDQLASDLGEALGRAGPKAPAILFLASMAEYLFPPFPGDLLVVLGAWYAIQGVLSWPLAFAATTAGAMLGSALDYALGRWLAPRLDAGATRRGPLSAERLARFVGAYRRWGPLLLVANRFLPGVRGFVFVAAGAAGIPFPRVLLLGGLSAALWNTLLLGAGALLARNLPELLELFHEYSTVAVGSLLAAAIALVTAVLLQRRARGAARGGR